jgi:hemoglobin
MRRAEIYTNIGGTTGCRRLAEALYERIGNDPFLRPLFPAKTFTCAIEEFSAFLVQFLGGPSEDTQRRWWLSLEESHRRFTIGKRERAAWLKHMGSALDSMPVDASVRDALRNYFEHASAHLVKMDAARIESPELAARWSGQVAIDHVIEAIRSRDAAAAIQAVNGLSVDDSVRCGLLAEMLQSRVDGMIEYVHDQVRQDSRLVRGAFNGRTLLNCAAALGIGDTVEVLLECGADPNAGRHPSLYSLANGFTGPGGGRIVRLLVQVGARINACENVKRCTALHMAARRGGAEVAEALLECGADINARDSKGDTPLRRALNLKKKAVAEFLAARGGRL